MLCTSLNFSFEKLFALSFVTSGNVQSCGKKQFISNASLKLHKVL